MKWPNDILEYSDGSFQRIKVMKLKVPNKCDCWVCSPILKSILNKLKGKELQWFEALVERCIEAEFKKIIGNLGRKSLNEHIQR